MRLTEQVQGILQAADLEGALAIDATAGNGHDTLGLAQAVGPNGSVIAIDLQTQAIESTQQRLRVANLLSRCQLLQGDHAIVLANLLNTKAGNARIILFNLGYLPGSDRLVQTSAKSTLPALDAARELLEAGGQLLVTAYRGHPGGMAEAQSINQWFSNLEQTEWAVEIFEPTGPTQTIPPILYTARKRT